MYCMMACTANSRLLFIPQGNSAAPSGSLAGESLQMVLEWTLPRDAYTFLRSFRFKSDDIKVVFAAQTAVGGAFD
jgi:hypothetical protein